MRFQDLTARQCEVLECIVDYMRLHDYPPTLRELGATLGIRSTNGVKDHLTALEKKGYLLRRRLASRGMTLTQKARPQPPTHGTEAGHKPGCQYIVSPEDPFCRKCGGKLIGGDPIPLCDGNHAMPVCDHHECWHREPPPVMVFGVDPAIGSDTTGVIVVSRNEDGTFSCREPTDAERREALGEISP